MDKNTIIDLIINNSVIETHQSFQLFKNSQIEINVNDRPKYVIQEGQLLNFLSEYKSRCEFLDMIQSINISNEIERMYDFLVATTNEIDVYHYSLCSHSTITESLSVGNISFHKLDELKYQEFLNRHKSVEFLLQQKPNSFPENYRLLIVSKERVKRMNVNPTKHIFYDKLDEIYSNHKLFLFLLNYEYGNINVSNNSISTDNFPHSNSSSSSKMINKDLSEISSPSRIIHVYNHLQNKLFYRLVMRSEYASKFVFGNTIYLRSLLDPFLNKNNDVIKNACPVRGRKTDYQSKFIFETIRRLNPSFTFIIDEAELSSFLRIRNNLIHPNPTESIEMLHLIYDKIAEFRKLIYEFIISSIVEIETNSLEDFEIQTTI